MKYLELLFLVLLCVCLHNVKSQGPLENFIKVENITLPAPKKRWGESVSVDKCAQKCLSQKTCVSFEIEDQICFLSKYATSDIYKPQVKEGRNYYRRINPAQEFIPVKYTTIPYHDDLVKMKNKTFDECLESCREEPSCSSFEVKLMCENCKRYLCDRATVSYLDFTLYPNYHGWSIYFKNPDYNNGSGNANENKPVELCQGSLPRSCVQFKKCNGVPSDGEHWIYPASLKGKKIKVYCDGMSTATPKEYITLKNPTYFEVPLVDNIKFCQLTGASGKTLYRKVQILVEKMVLNLSEKKFATIEPILAGNQKCSSQQNITINLRETGFAIDEKARWTTRGNSVTIGSTQLSNENQKAVIICTGKCGSCQSINPFPVVLFEQDEPAINSAKTCDL